MDLMAPYSNREVEEKLAATLGQSTKLTQSTIGKLRKERTRWPHVHPSTARAMLDYLRRTGNLPERIDPESDGYRTLEDVRGSRVALAVRHFASPSVIRMMGWSPRDVINAVSAYLNEELADDREMREFVEWRDAYLALAEVADAKR